MTVSGGAILDKVVMGSLSEETCSRRSQPPEEQGKNSPGRGQSKSPNGENGLRVFQEKKEEQ